MSKCLIKLASNQIQILSLFMSQSWSLFHYAIDLRHSFRYVQDAIAFLTHQSRLYFEIKPMIQLLLLLIILLISLLFSLIWLLLMNRLLLLLRNFVIFGLFHKSCHSIFSLLELVTYHPDLSGCFWAQVASLKLFYQLLNVANILLLRCHERLGLKDLASA